MGMLLGGPLTLKREGNFDNDLIIFFMFLIFFFASITEILLYRQLGRLSGQSKTNKQHIISAPPLAAEYYGPQQRSLPEPVPSVTENTTRTLEYQRNQGRKDY